MISPFQQTALSRLVGQFKNSKRVNALVESMVTPLEALSTLYLTLKEQRWIDSAYGRQLDHCGYIVGVTRGSLDDETYRTAIKARILSNISTGTPESLINGVRFLTDPTEVQYLESYPACALLFTNGKTIPPNSQQILQATAPVAISDLPLIVSYGHSKPFRLGRLDIPMHLGVSTTIKEKQRITVNQDKLAISNANPVGVVRLSGIILNQVDLSVNNNDLDVGIGTLTTTDTNNYSIYDNGYHLPGVFQ